MLLKMSKFKSFLLISIFIFSTSFSTKLNSLDTKKMELAAGAALLAGLTRYAWLEYRKPNENKLSEFYRNRSEKNIIKSSAAILLSIWAASKIRQNPKKFKETIIDIAKSPQRLSSMLTAFTLAYAVYKQASLMENMFGADKSKVYKAGEIKERFESVAGAESAKEELKEVIDYLKNPKKYEKIGTKVRRGLLLTGSPGNGKTLLAKAVAGEANCAFLYISGSTFNAKFVGAGVDIVKQLFRKARDLAPCIIFIDEFDSVGAKRTHDSGTGHINEGNKTLNELLTQLDGFEQSNAPIVLLAATNKSEVLDEALLRPGRIDRKIEVELPDIQSREKILKIHAKNYKIDPLVKFEAIAKMAIGFSGAELANLINEASYIAVANGQEAITLANFAAAYEKLRKELKNKEMFGTDRSKVYKPGDIKETFESVAGAIEAKQELKDIIDFLRDPKKFQELGTKVRRGILLTGAPGNGKTLLAKATAGEANCAFLYINGSAFSNRWVGAGGDIVRDLFSKARKLAPCIIFIDELDSVGMKREEDSGTGYNAEGNKTLNELLTQLDGFETIDAPIVLLAATNNHKVIDKALLRPGRIDRIIEVPLPDIQDREKILKVHAKNYKVDPSLDFAEVANMTMGFSGAELANLINEASYIALSKGRQFITIDNFIEAHEKITLGKESTTIVSESDKKITAYHEAGHALVELLLNKEKSTLEKVTIVPRSHGVGGFTKFMAREDSKLKTKVDLLKQVKISLGGRAAEEIIFGDVTTGAYDDLEKATQILRTMVRQLGMSEHLGLVTYNASQSDVAACSQDTARKIDEEVSRIMSACYKEVMELLTGHRGKLEKLAHELLKHETLNADHIKKLLSDN